MADYATVKKTNFAVEIDGIDYDNFISVTGLGGTADIADDLGGKDKFARKVAGNITYETVTMTRNWDPKNDVLINWWKTVEDPTQKPEKKPVSIVIHDDQGTEVKRRNLFNAVPCGWDMSDLGSTESGVMTETISLVYESGEWK